MARELRDLGGRYHRYLHQDEFGPSRAERMAALRVPGLSVAVFDNYGVIWAKGYGVTDVETRAPVSPPWRIAWHRVGCRLSG